MSYDGSLGYVLPTVEWTIRNLIDTPPELNIEGGCTLYQDPIGGCMSADPLQIEGKTLQKIKFNFKKNGTTISCNDLCPVSLTALKVLAIIRRVLTDAKFPRRFNNDQFKEADNSYAHELFWRDIQYYDGGLDCMIGREHEGDKKLSCPSEPAIVGNLVVARRSDGSRSIGKIVKGSFGTKIIIGYNKNGHALAKDRFSDDADSPDNVLGTW